MYGVNMLSLCFTACVTNRAPRTLYKRKPRLRSQGQRREFFAHNSSDNARYERLLAACAPLQEFHQFLVAQGLEMVDQLHPSARKQPVHHSGESQRSCAVRYCSICPAMLFDVGKRSCKNCRTVYSLLRRGAIAWFTTVHEAPPDNCQGKVTQPSKMPESCTHQV